jgi:hypothetical protein
VLGLPLYDLASFSEEFSAGLAARELIGDTDESNLAQDIVPGE